MAISRKITTPTQGRSSDLNPDSKHQGGVGEKEKKVAVSVLVPHITEKASLLGENNGYVFKIKPEFNKIMVRQAVKKQYNVEPTKVRIINIPGKTVFIRRRQAQKAGYKKAIVYLKKGEKITF